MAKRGTKTVAKRTAERPLTKADLEESLAKVLGHVDGRFEQVDRRFEQVESRLDGVDRRLDGVDRRLDGVDQRLDGMDRHFDQIDQRFIDQERWINVRFDEQDRLMKKNFAELGERIEIQIRAQTANLEEIKSLNRSAMDAVRNEREGRQGMFQALREEVLPRLEVVEQVVKEHSAALETKADKSLEQRVEALEDAASRR